MIFIEPFIKQQSLYSFQESIKHIPKYTIPWARCCCLDAQSCPTLCDPMDYSPLCPWGFSTQQYWSGLPCPPPRDLPNPGIEPRYPAFQTESLLSEAPQLINISSSYNFKAVSLLFSCLIDIFNKCRMSTSNAINLILNSSCFPSILMFPIFVKCYHHSPNCQATNEVIFKSSHSPFLHSRH